MVGRCPDDGGRRSRAGGPAPARRYHTGVVSPFLPDADKVAAVRALLPATGAGIYLNAGTAGPMPAEVQRAIDEQADRELAIGRAHVDLWPETQQRMAEARAAVAAVLVADPDDIALTHSTTDGMNLAVGALPWRTGDRVVTTNHEHPGGLGPLLALHARLGVEVVFADVGDGGDDEATLAAVATALQGGARAVVCSHVLWTTGAVLPIARIAALARAAGAAVIADGAQGAGAIGFAVEELGVDAYALPAQKWLLGPEGMGALWASPTFAGAVTPASAGWLSYAAFDAATPALHPGARRFEASNFHRPSIVGLARSCGWLSMYVGLPWAWERSLRLAGTIAERLAAVRGVTVVTPRPCRSPLVSFRVAGWEAGAVVEELGRRAFAITREVPAIGAVRLSVGWWTTDDELDRVAAVVELLAGAGPDALPPPRHLPILGSDGRPIA